MKKSIDEMIKMIECCYFTGACKLCPFYKAPKFGAVGKCEGMTKVGTDLLDWFCEVKAGAEADQPPLFTVDEPGSDDVNPVIPLDALPEMIGERVWLCEHGSAALFRIVRMNTEESDYVILSHEATDTIYYRPVEEYGDKWELRRECPQTETENSESGMTDR